MTDPVHDACSFGFDQLSLPREERQACRAAIRQDALRKAGFREEGLANEYLKIDGQLVGPRPVRAAAGAAYSS